MKKAEIVKQLESWEGKLIETNLAINGKRLMVIRKDGGTEKELEEWAEKTREKFNCITYKIVLRGLKNYAEVLI